MSLFVVFNTLPIKARAEKAAPSVSAQSAVLIDTSSMAVLFEKNANERLGMASTTKIMTALIAAERGDFDMLVRIPDEAIGVEGSSIYLQKGEVLSLRELLYALLLQSANDAATAIAIAIAGDVDSFADMMNERAAQMGLSDTHFTNPHGLYDEDHYTTAYDLAIISAHALKNEKISGIFSTYKQTLPIDTVSQKRVLVNHNKLLRLYRGAIGMKTGFTKKTGRCLVSAAERDSLTLIAVTLNAPDDWNDHMAMLDFGFDNFESLKIADAGGFSYSLAAVGGKRDTVTMTNAEELRITVPRERGELDVSVESFHRFELAPIFKGAELGRVRFSYDKRFYAEATLIAAEDLQRSSKNRGFFYKLFHLFS